MSESIQEIPLDIAEEVQDIVEDVAEIKAGEEPVILDPGEEVKPVTQSIKPKAKGRPKGALNKGPSKPRAKKTQIQETPVEHGQDSPLAYKPSSPKRDLKLPTDPSTSDVAAAMLKLLQDQSYSRQSRNSACITPGFSKYLLINKCRRNWTSWIISIMRS